jgi:uncharacterized membrane protein YsdA (DUF1294 family)
MNRQTVVVIALAVIAVMNVVAFTLMGIDKRRARRDAWRISERALFMTTACFGGLGGVLGMKVFHHKTQHWYCRVFFPVLLVVQIVLLAVGAYLLMR